MAVKFEEDLRLQHRKVPMAGMIKDNTGFTLIELLMVVAVIGILVGIALPQFQNYRTKTFNAASLSDVKTFKLYMESAYAEKDIYPSF